MEALKRVEPVGRTRGRLTVVCEVVDEEERKMEEWNKKNEMGQIEDTLGEL